MYVCMYVKHERVILDRLSHSLIDLFHNGCQLMFSFICMIISLSDLFSMCKIRKNPYFQTRPERLIMIHIKDDSQEDIKVRSMEMVVTRVDTPKSGIRSETGTE